MLAPDTLIQERYRIVYALEERPDVATYRVRDEQTGRLALLAVLPISSPQHQRELESAAQQLGTVHHDLLLPIERTFVMDQSFYLVSADSGGQDLERTLRSGAALPEAATLASVTRLLDLIDILHSQEPPLLLGDLGVGEVWVAEDVWKLAPYALLTPIGRANSPYRAPELLDPNADPSTASDTYTLSALLYHVLTGWAPPPADQIAAGAPLNPPRALNPNISALAEQALLRGLQVKSLNRYQNARELRLALDTVRMMAGRSLGIGPEALQNPPAARPAALPDPAPAALPNPAPAALPNPAPAALPDPAAAALPDPARHLQHTGRRRGRAAARRQHRAAWSGSSSGCC